SPRPTTRGGAGSCARPNRACRRASRLRAARCAGRARRSAQRQVRGLARQCEGVVRTGRGAVQRRRSASALGAAVEGRYGPVRRARRDERRRAVPCAPRTVWVARCGGQGPQAPARVGNRLQRRADRASRTMNLFDMALVMAALVSVIIGAIRGFVKEAAALAGWVLAVALVLNASVSLGQRLPFDAGSVGVRTGIAAIVIVLVCVLTAHLVGRTLHAAISAAHLSGADRALGALFGIGRAAAVW